MEILREYRSKVVAVAMLVALAVGVYGLYNYQTGRKSAKQVAPDQSSQAAAEVQKLVGEVGKLIELPSGEQPIVATVTDKSQLPNQLFFAKAKNGDKVLIYSQAKMAYLYDPVSRKLVEVAPVVFGQGTVAGTSSAQAVKLRGTIYNGARVAGASERLEKQMEGKVTNLTIVGKGNTVGIYDKTVVVDLTGKYFAAASDLAKYLGVSVGSVPGGEVVPTDSDLLVIVGADLAKRQ